MESVEVKPRFVDAAVVSPTSSQVPSPSQPFSQPLSQSQAPMQAPIQGNPPEVKGLFTSLYENKIIVLIIVIVILIIGALSCIFYRKPEEMTPKPKAKVKPQLCNNCNNSINAASSQNTQESIMKKQAPSQSGPSGQSGPSAQSNQDDIDYSELLERSNNIISPTLDVAEQPIKSPAPSPQPVVHKNSKTNEELMQLMEDGDETTHGDNLAGDAEDAEGNQ
jgi:hypothetical protein